MYKTILVPVDLAHSERLDKALTIAADLAKLYGALIHVVGVTASAPSEVASDPAGFLAALQVFATEESAKRGVEMRADAVTSHDPTRDLDAALSAAIHDVGADLVVMASHVPGFMDHLFTSNAGYLVTHSDVSVFVVR